MEKQNNDVSFLKNIKIIYDKNNLVSQDMLSKYILDSTSFKVKVFSTMDGKTVLTNDLIIDSFKEKNIKLNKVTYDEYISKFDFKPNEYVLVKDLLKDTKGNVVTYIEVVNEGKKHNIERDLIEMIRAYGIKAVVVSKSENVIKYLKKKAPSIIRGISFNCIYDDKIGYFEKSKIKNVKFSKSIMPDIIDFDIKSLPNNNLKKYSDKGILISTNLIDTEAKMNKATLNADVYILNNEL